MRSPLDDKMFEFFQQHDGEVFTVTNITEEFPDFTYATVRIRLLWLWRKDKIGRRKVGSHLLYGMPTAIEESDDNYFKDEKPIDDKKGGR